MAKQVAASSNTTAEAKKKATAEILSDEKAAAKTQEELIRRANKAKVDAIADALDAEKKANAEAVASAKQAKAEQAKADRDAARAARTSAREVAAAQKAASTEVAAAAKAAAKAVADEQKKANEEMGRSEALGSKFLGTLGQMAGAAVGITGLVGVIDQIGDAFAKAKAQAIEAGKFVEDYRKALKELAFLKGEPGATSPVLRADLEFRQKTLQDQPGSRGLQEEFRNSAGISIDTKDTKAKMTEEEAVKGMIYAGQMQSMYGGEGKAYGTLAGVIPSTEKADRVSGDDIKRRMYQLTKIGEKGRSSPAEFANQMAKSAYLTQGGGGFDSMGQMGAYGSALSLSRPEAVADGLGQLSKMTSLSINDMTKGPNAKMSPGDYLRSLGLSDQNNIPQMLQAMMKDMEKTETEMKTQGKNFNVGTYLQEKGYDREEMKVTFQQLYARRKDLNNTLIPMGEKMPTVAEAEDPFNKFKATPQGLQQKAAVDSDRAKTATGAGAMEYMKALREQAYNTMSADDKAWGSIEDYQNSWWKSDTLDQRAGEILRQEGLSKGLKYEQKFYGKQKIDPLSDLESGQTGGKTRAEAFYRRGQEIAQAGGDPLGSNSKLLRDMNENLKRSADALDKTERALRGIKDKMDPPAVQIAKPGGANARPVR